MFPADTSNSAGVKIQPPVLSGAVPVVGHGLQLLRGRDELFRAGYRKHGDIFTVLVGRTPVVVVTGSELTKTILADPSFDVGDGYAFLRPLIGETFLAAASVEHRKYRSIVREIFTPSRTEKSAEAAFAEAGAWVDGLGRSGHVAINDIVLGVVRRMMQHSFMDPAHPLDDQFWRASDKIRRTLNPYLDNVPIKLPRDRVRRTARATMTRTVLDAIADRKSAAVADVDLLSLLARARKATGEQLTTEEMLNIFIGIFEGGHETTAGQVTWLIGLLAQHPSYVEKMLPEIDGFSDDATRPNGLIERLKSMPLTLAAVDETLRMRPSASSQFRVATAPTSLLGYEIPAGQAVMTAAATTNYLPDEFTDPTLFDPTRFLGPARQGRRPGAIVSFGLGSHQCPGMDIGKIAMMVISACLLERYDVRLRGADIKTKIGMGADQPSTVVLDFNERS